VESELKDFFLKARKADLKKEAGDIARYELAMAMEKRGYKAYETFYRQAKSEWGKEFLLN